MTGTVWALGDYPTIAREILAPLGPELVVACGVGPGMRVLDVGAGTGNAAIPLAYSAVTYAGHVHLVHVLEASHDPMTPYDIFASPEQDTPARAEARRQLQDLVPRDFGGAAATTHVHLLEEKKPQTAICQAAERLGVDLICLGTHGRTGLSRAILGSVAGAVLEQTRRPVLLARPPRA